MNRYDDEDEIINDFQLMPISSIKFVNFSFGLLLYFTSIYFPKLFKKWKNNTETRPDYYNDTHKYMMEVMRFDDYKPGKDSQNALETKQQKEIESVYRKHTGISTKDAEIKIIVIPHPAHKPKDGIKLMFENFSNTYLKHSSKTEKYRELFPGYKLGFFLCDESAAYIETKYKIEDPHPGDQTGPFRVYENAFDKVYQEVLLQADIDYLIWFKPYCDISNLIIKGPKTKQIYLIDIKKARKYGLKNYGWNYDNIVSAEVSYE